MPSLLWSSLLWQVYLACTTAPAVNGFAVLSPKGPEKQRLAT